MSVSKCNALVRSVNANIAAMNDITLTLSNMTAAAWVREHTAVNQLVKQARGVAAAGKVHPRLSAT